MEYHVLLEELTGEMTRLEGIDIARVYATVTQLCILLRISRGVTSFYDSPADEKRGKGEVFVCYDSGEPSHPVSTLRNVTPAQMVEVCEVYQADGAAPLTDEERKRVELIQRMMISFMSRRRLQRMVERMTYRDADGYANLRWFFGEIMRRIRTDRIADMAAIRFNLKHFSLINDQLGREKGDRIIRAYCDEVEAAMGEEGVLARMGGDNFVALCPKDRLEGVIACLKGRQIPLDDEQQVEISAAAGIYVVPDAYDVTDPGDVMDRIISAYQSAKRGSAEDIVYYSEALRLERQKTIKIQQRFGRALRAGEFLVYYQPKVDIATRELIGAEALCRWKRKGRIIPPLDFIPALERGMDICRLDFYVLDRVCQDIRRWLDEGRNVVRVSVNLSRRHMMDPNLLQHIVEIIDRHGVPHEYVEIELTETTTDVEFRELKRVVSGLQEAGVFASVDDFGVGYSSLNLIKEIPWDVLKLDKSLLPAFGEKRERGSMMFAHVISMAHDIGMKCVAEGVETNDQLEILHHYGCRIAQGFLFDRPLPVDEFEQRLQMRRYPPAER